MTDTETEPEVVEAEDTTPLDLWTWGLSGQPSSWALSTWSSTIDVIRAANNGVMDAGAVQDALDVAFPGAGYQAADVMLAHPVSAVFDAEVDGLEVHVDLVDDGDLGLPDQNVIVDWGDGTSEYTTHGDHTYEAAGEYVVSCTIMVGGAAHATQQIVAVGDLNEVMPAAVNPAVAGRAATVFESVTDDWPNNNVTDSVPVVDEDGGSEVFDPADHTVAEVLDYAAEHPDEVAAIAAAEEAGKNRSTLLDQL
jgi:plastocyanin